MGGNERRRAPALALALLTLATLPACFIEAAAGGYSVSGANDPHARVAPGFGVSVGVAYDAKGVTRLSAGGGGQMVRTPVNGVENVILAGPVITRLDLGAPLHDEDGPSLRAAAALAWGGGWRLRASPTGGNTEGRDLGSAIGAFLGPSLSIPVGSARVDIAVGPSAIFTWGSVGLTDSQSWGAEARVTVSLPLDYEGGLLVGASVMRSIEFASSPEVVAEAKRLREIQRKEDFTRRAAEIQQMQDDNAATRPDPLPESKPCPPGTHLIGAGTCGP